MAELRTLVRPDEQVNLYAISIDPPEQNREFAARIAQDGQGEVRFMLLSDPDRRTINAYGLRDAAYQESAKEGIPHPAVYVIDKAGRVVWAKIESDYRQRPTNAELRAALDALNQSQTR